MDQDQRYDDPQKLHLLVPRGMDRHAVRLDVTTMGAVDYIRFMENRMASGEIGLMAIVRYATVEAAAMAQERFWFRYKARPAKYARDFNEAGHLTRCIDCDWEITSRNASEHRGVCSGLNTAPWPVHPAPMPRRRIGTVHRFCGRFIFSDEWDAHLLECNPRRWARVLPPVAPRSPSPVSSDDEEVVRPALPPLEPVSPDYSPPVSDPDNSDDEEAPPVALLPLEPVSAEGSPPPSGGIEGSNDERAPSAEQSLVLYRAPSPQGSPHQIEPSDTSDDSSSSYEEIIIILRRKKRKTH